MIAIALAARAQCAFPCPSKGRLIGDGANVRHPRLSSSACQFPIAATERTGQLVREHEAFRQVCRLLPRLYSPAGAGLALA
jgi:hypothetical protein